VRWRELPAVQLLRRIWAPQCEVAAERVRRRASAALPPATDPITPPHEPEARYAVKGGQGWTGDKVQLTETCDAERPHRISQGTTTLAPAADIEPLAPIQEALAGKGLPPSQQADDHQWQARAGTGFAGSHLPIDGAAQVVTCPRGHPSVRGCQTETARGRTMLPIDVAATDCSAGPVRTQCTRAKTLPRSLTLQPRAEHEAIQAARSRQQTADFAAAYARRAGIEGSLAQGIRAFGLRTARYRGVAKTHLQQVAIAAAINVQRVTDWLDDRPRATTRRSPLARLAAAA
jgi:transposase